MPDVRRRRPSPGALPPAFERQLAVAAPVTSRNARSVRSTTVSLTPLAPFYSRFRELAFREMRTVLVPQHPSLPPLPWGFLEFYCTDADCDCRRVLLHVIRQDSGNHVWASINFGWESRAFYRRWVRDARAAKEMTGASLDPFNPQSEHSQALLLLFRDVLLKDAPYVERLKRHYRLFKGYPEPQSPEASRSNGPQSSDA